MGKSYDLQSVVKAVEWLIFDKSVKNRRELAEKLGYTESSFSQILNGKVVISERFIKKLLDFDARLNPQWLIEGKEPMLRPAREALKNAEMNAISTGKIIPYFDAEAAAGSSYGMSMEPARPVGMIEIGGLLKDSESALRVYGNSMTPNYPSGCVVGTKVHTDSFIEPGSVYLVETRENRYLKRLYYNKDKTAFRCVSDNHMTHESGPMKGELCYPEFEIPFNEVVRLHRVTGVIKRNII